MENLRSKFQALKTKELDKIKGGDGEDELGPILDGEGCRRSGSAFYEPLGMLPLSKKGI